MHLIQPCCVKKDLRELRDAIAKGGTKDFEGYGDLSLTELLPALLLRYDGVEMMIVAPSLPDQATEVIDWWMNKQWPTKDGKGKLDVISRLTIVADLSREKSPVASMWKKVKPFGGRLVLHDMQQDSTAILLPDFAITGPVNMRYGHHFIATATTETEKVKALWEKYREMTENAPLPNAETTVTATEPKSTKKRTTRRKPKK